MGRFRVQGNKPTNGPTAQSASGTVTARTLIARTLFLLQLTVQFSNFPLHFLAFTRYKNRVEEEDTPSNREGGKQEGEIN